MIYDCVIIGGGPAGLTAGIYLARANKNVAIIEKMSIGGQVAEIGNIENYPGFTSVAGSELSMNMYNQAKSFGVKFVFGEAVEYDFDSEVKTIKTTNGILQAKTIILAIGSVARHLNVQNENDFVGKGVSYCATCDGNFFKNKVVAVVGSGDSAVSNAEYLSPIVKKVYIISKYAPLKLKNVHAESVEKIENAEVILEGRVIEILGKDKVEGVKVEQNGEIKTIELDGIFVSVGRTPDTELIKDKIDVDEKGYIKSNSDMETNIKGVFVAGDIISGSFKQIVTASASGAIASTSVLKYLSGIML